MISVVIPLYNKEKSIASTLQSVYEQTYTDYEVVIVNDGSTDKSLDAVNDFVSRLEIGDRRLTIVSQENAGVSSARNAGIMAARGEYVAFLDGDDRWTTDYLDTLSKLIKDYPDAGLYFIGYAYIRDMHDIPTNGSKRENGYRGRIDNPWNIQLDVFTGSCAGNRERIIKLGMFDTRMTHGEDLDLFWRLILDGGLVVDEKCCAYYRLDSENRAMGRPIPLEKHIPYYTEKYAELRAENAEFRRFFDEQMIYRLYPYMLNKKYRKEARKIAKQFDYSQLKWSMHFRMLLPKTYYYLRKLVSK